MKKWFQLVDTRAAQKVAQALKGASGEQLQNLSNRLDRGKNVGRAATRSGLGDVAALARAGDIETKDIQAYIAQASRDRKTLNQMDKFQINERKNQLRAQGKSCGASCDEVRRHCRIKSKGIM